MTDTFSDRLLAWFERHGRHDLPWQTQRSAYRVWVSEIMLQQTQVATVVTYFERFVARFPDVATLAAAPLDEVLGYWSGLGYYARARNLHSTAQRIVGEFNGQFPRSPQVLAALPGIGRSTAGAIAAQAFDARHAILDGNVKRVLSRYHAVSGWPGEKAVENRLWEFAEQHTPAQQVRDYTQAIMDLGATLCTRSRPRCTACPLAGGCAAQRLQQQHVYPASKPRKSLPVRNTTMIMLHNNQQQILLARRPPTGIWGGLWSFPECARPEEAVAWSAQQLHCGIEIERQWESLRHTFSHFHLDITPISARLIDSRGVMDPAQGAWYNLAQTTTLGLAAPVKRLLAALQEVAATATVQRAAKSRRRNAHA
jgi:A/G-specific adenine glycosylase